MTLNDLVWPFNWATAKCTADALSVCVAELLVELVTESKK